MSIPQSLHEYLKERDSVLAHSLLDPPRGRLLDIGSGDGEDMRHLVRRGWDVLGVELYQNPGFGKWVKSRVERLPFKDGSFAAVTCILVVPQLAYPKNGLREAYRILKPGGKGVFVVFSSSPLNLRVGITGENYPKAGQVLRSRLFSARMFAGMLEDVGFRSVQVHRSDYLPWFTNRLSERGRQRLFELLSRAEDKISKTPLRFLARKLSVTGVKV